MEKHIASIDMIRVQFDNYTTLQENFRNVLNCVQIIAAKHYMFSYVIYNIQPSKSNWDFFEANEMYEKYESIVLFDRQHT